MPEQVILNGQVSVGTTPDGQTAIVIDPGTGRTYVMPLPPESAQTIGKALLAPRVAQPSGLVPANGNGHG